MDSIDTLPHYLARAAWHDRLGVQISEADAPEARPSLYREERLSSARYGGSPRPGYPGGWIEWEVEVDTSRLGRPRARKEGPAWAWWVLCRVCQPAPEICRSAFRWGDSDVCDTPAQEARARARLLDYFSRLERLRLRLAALPPGGCALVPEDLAPEVGALPVASVDPEEGRKPSLPPLLLDLRGADETTIDAIAAAWIVREPDPDLRPIGIVLPSNRPDLADRARRFLD